MPFMDEAFGARFSSNGAKFTYGPLLQGIPRNITTKKKDKEPEWRKPGKKITSGYQPAWSINHKYIIILL